MKQPLPKGANLRADAAWVLYQILEEGVSARECLPKAQGKHSNPRDRNWLNETTMGVLRNLPLMQSWLRPMLAKPLKGDKKIVEHLLLVGFYQLAFMRVSDHAATNETVAATIALKAGGLKGLVNGILRQFKRQDHAPAKNETVAAGLPAWLYKRIQASYPEDFANIIHAMNSKPPIWLRVNTEKTSHGTYQEQLADADISFTLSAEHPDAIILEKGDVTQLPSFDAGLFAVQDGAAQLAAKLLNPQNDERILDCCAAPGGKTCHLFATAPQSSLFAMDSDKRRLAKIEENLARLGAKAQLKHADATNPNDWWDGLPYDRILLDAPCSATGIIRRHPDIRWLRKQADIAPLVELQGRLLDAMWSVLKSKGTLLYATCSLLPEENCDQIAAFLARTKDAQLDGFERQILPGEEQMDGFYYARLVKS